MKKFIIDLEDLDHFLSDKDCLHTFQYSLEWAAKQGLPKEAIEEMANELDVHCDCELVEILGDIGDSFEVILEEPSVTSSHKWMIPLDFVLPSPNKVYHHLIVSPPPSATTIKCYTTPGEVLIPAPVGYQPAKKMRKQWHFFVGLESGLPSEGGIIQTCPPITASEFLERVKKQQLAGFADVDLLVASFYLEQIANMTPGHGVGVHFLEVLDLGSFGKTTRLRLTRRLL